MRYLARECPDGTARARRHTFFWLSRHKRPTGSSPDRRIRAAGNVTAVQYNDDVAQQD